MEVLGLALGVNMYQLFIGMTAFCFSSAFCLGEVLLLCIPVEVITIVWGTIVYKDMFLIMYSACHTVLYKTHCDWAMN